MNELSATDSSETQLRDLQDMFFWNLDRPFPFRDSIKTLFDCDSDFEYGMSWGLFVDVFFVVGKKAFTATPEEIDDLHHKFYCSLEEDGYERHDILGALLSVGLDEDPRDENSNLGRWFCAAMAKIKSPDFQYQDFFLKAAGCFSGEGVAA